MSARQNLSAPSRLDDGFHVREVLLERAASRGRQAKLGPRHPPFESLVADDVVGLFELAGVDAQIAVGRLQQRLQVVEAETIVDRERADDAEPKSLVNQPIELERALFRNGRNPDLRLETCDLRPAESFNRP